MADFPTIVDWDGELSIRQANHIRNVDIHVANVKASHLYRHKNYDQQFWQQVHLKEMTQMKLVNQPRWHHHINIKFKEMLKLLFINV